MAMKWRIHAWTILGLLVTYKVSNALQQRCNIKPGTSNNARTDEKALMFSFTDIQSNLDIFSPVAVEDHLYTVNNCITSMYMLSAVTEGNDLLESLEVAGTGLTCRVLEGTPTNASGTILKFFGQQKPRPLEVPASWYIGRRVVLKITFYTFPTTTRLKLHCGVTREVYDLLEVEVYADITIDKIGCPIQRYGTSCQKKCTCENGGYCHTFLGNCICSNDYIGPRCETAVETPRTTTMTPTDDSLNTNIPTEKPKNSTENPRTTTMTSTIPTQPSTASDDGLKTNIPTENPKLSTGKTVGDGTSTSSHTRSDSLLIVTLLICLFLSFIFNF